MSGGTIITPNPEPSAVKPDDLNQNPNAPDAGEAGGSEGGDPTSLIGGKFKSQDELLKAYQELEKKQGGVKPDPEPAPEAGADDDDPAAQALQVAGLDMAEFTAEFTKDGKLSDASYAKLNAAGFPKSVVDQYIRGGQAQTLENDTNRAAEGKAVAEAGITDVNPLLAWAANNLPPQEIGAFNRIMDSGEHAAMVWALSGLKGKYEKAMGSDPSLINGQPAGAGDIYESSAQVVADMKKAEYKSDPAFREQVRQKLARSNVFNRPRK